MHFLVASIANYANLSSPIFVGCGDCLLKLRIYFFIASPANYANLFSTSSFEYGNYLLELGIYYVTANYANLYSSSLVGSAWGLFTDVLLKMN